MAGIKQPIQDVLARLATIQVTNGDGTTVPLYVRIWNNQLKEEKDGKRETYPRPAAFVEIANKVTYKQLGVGVREADLAFYIHIIHEFYNQDGTFDQDLDVFDLRDQVVRTLSNYNPTACSVLESSGEEQDYDHGNIYHYIVSFVCNFIDSTGSPYDDAAGNYVEKAPQTNLQIIQTVTKQ